MFGTQVVLRIGLGTVALAGVAAMTAVAAAARIRLEPPAP